MLSKSIDLYMPTPYYCMTLLAVCKINFIWKYLVEALMLKYWKINWKWNFIKENENSWKSISGESLILDWMSWFFCEILQKEQKRDFHGNTISFKSQSQQSQTI